MTSQPYFFESRNLVAAFVSAFDNIVINRYDANRNVQNQIQVRYLYAPKQRVLYDLVNKAQNITLPVVSVWVTSINRDVKRVFNKLQGFTFSTGNYLSSGFVGSPVPVDINVSMSIVTKYQADMDQILSNFIPYNNPYIILSWKIPAAFGLQNSYEIRSEVEWNGNIGLTYPTDINAAEKYKVTADTSFIIRGWLFPAANNNTISNIYYISAFHHVESLLTTYETMSADTIFYPLSTGLVQETETVVLSGNTNNISISAIESFII